MAEGSQADAGAENIREGLAEVLPTNQQRKDGKSDVFYNPAQVFNRDLSILVISCFAKLRSAEAEEKRKKREERAQVTGKEGRSRPPPGLKVLEALAATGIRSVRYCKELGEGAEGVRKIVANDLDPNAVEHMKRNFAHNALPSDRVEAVCGDANAHMYSHKSRGQGGLGDESYDVIDLDPYGSVSPFIDAAVQAIADGGLLCITSTDMPVLGGNHPETCFARYGGAALKASYVHEMALRLVLHAVSTTAARYGREVRPLLCCSIDFYVRLFVRVFDSPARAKRQASKTAIVHQCVQCESFFVQKFGEIAEEGKEVKYKPAKVVVPGSECPECKGRMKLGGPFHSGSLYDESFLEKCLEACSTENMPNLPGVTSWKKITGMLTAMNEEHGDLALYYRLPQLCKSLKLNPVPLRQFRGTLVSLGYRVSHFHREPEAVKTDAPNDVVFDLMRLWAEEHPPKNCTLPEILKKELTLTRPIEWRTEEEASRGSKVAKFLPNPEKNWGPKPRARSGGAGEKAASADADDAQSTAAECADLPASKKMRTEEAQEAAAATSGAADAAS
eukprot:TRINITY_DN27251_c0_g1_i1.p1 TRINITY_DN27251_c0_g1~~TRINITY_DN27251_c0_g1_i1.p1  ORF type:complete len:561 (+),score=144.57 TRINITY_DN27251_c0_g1_i1:77-1759(+)